MSTNAYRELTDLIADANPDLPFSEALGQARQISDAGYRKRTVLTTLDDIEALPAHTIILTSQRAPVQKDWQGGGWHFTPVHYTAKPDPSWLPATVLYDPSEES